MKHKIPMRKALEDPNLLGGALPGPTWLPWRILLIALMGESLTDSERVVFKEITGRDHELGFRVEEFIGVIGRRGGKSRAMAALVAYVTGLCDHPQLVLGERGMALIIASDQEQALTCLSYCEAAFRGSPMLRQLVESKTQKQIRLTNGLLIMVRASDYRRVRGVTLLLAIADEMAFWTPNADSANPDTEIIGALRPALATCGGLLCLISSPHAKRGELWDLYKKYYGASGDPRRDPRGPSGKPAVVNGDRRSADFHPGAGGGLASRHQSAAKRQSTRTTISATVHRPAYEARREAAAGVVRTARHRYQ